MRGPIDRELRVAAIVPAYNEEETLADVLSVLRSTDLVDEVLVVSDGSTDRTVEVAQAMGIKGIHLKANQGKGVAMAVGVAHTSASILVFVDGDILQLSEYLLSQLIDPVVQGQVAMSIGVRNRGWFINLLHRKTGPLLSGIRCLKREVFEAVPAQYLEGFRIETALNWACRKLEWNATSIVLYGLKHRVKEKKRGLAVGLHARFSMFSSVFVAWLSLKLRPPVLRGIDLPAVTRPELDYIDF